MTTPSMESKRFGELKVGDVFEWKGARFQVTALPDAHVGEATCLRGNSRESAAGDTGCPFGYRVLVKVPA